MTWQLTQTGASFSGTITISGDILMGQTTGTVSGTWMNSADIPYTVTIAPDGMAGQPGCSLVFSGLFGVFNGPKIVGEKTTRTFCGNISSRSTPVDPVSSFSLLKQ